MLYGIFGVLYVARRCAYLNVVCVCVLLVNCVCSSHYLAAEIQTVNFGSLHFSRVGCAHLVSTFWAGPNEKRMIWPHPSWKLEYVTSSMHPLCASMLISSEWTVPVPARSKIMYSFDKLVKPFYNSI